jgi:hypothetical protein
MKKSLIAISLACASWAAQAETGFFLGVSMQLGGGLSARDIGLTAKVVSSRREDHAIAAAGLSVYPFGKGDTRVGTDLSIGYQGTHAGALIGYDLLQRMPVVGVGYVNTKKPAAAPLPPV